jgi:hypothetical protein
MTVPVWKKGLGLQQINDVRICCDFRWTSKHLESLKVAYANSPYFAEHLPFIKQLFSGGFERLIDFNLCVINYLLEQLRIHTRLVLLSELGVEARGDLLPVEICRKLGSLHFTAQYSARKYLSEDLFRESGIELQFFKPPSPVYPQLWGGFINNLSAFDLIFNCGPKAKEIMLRT